jgi:hypothetical protein
MASSHAYAWTFRSTLAVIITALTLTVAPTVAAHHTEDEYGRRGYVWLQYWYNGTIWVTSTNCNPREAAAYDNVLNSTAGKPEFVNRWSAGIKLIQKTCDGEVTTQIDIKIKYTNFCTEFGSDWCDVWGRNISDKAEASWCALWNKPHPCGSHPSHVYVNNPKWNDSSRSQEWKEHLIAHETGHSLGIAHHCKDINGNPEDAIMNTPVGEGSSCTVANWENITGWKPSDRQAHKNVYPNWQGP